LNGVAAALKFGHSIPQDGTAAAASLNRALAICTAAQALARDAAQARTF
jgi:hypothetical protein